MEKEILAGIGVVLSLIGYGAYIYSIYRGETRPHPFSWFIWGLLTAIGFFAQIADNAGPGAWITGVSALVTFFIAAIGYLKRADIVITRTDWITFLAAIAAIPLWLLTETPLYSVILITTIDSIAFYPTFHKSWYQPNQELVFEYILAALKYSLSIFALSNYSIITTLYPLSLVVMNILFIGMVYYRRKSLKHVTE